MRLMDLAHAQKRVVLFPVIDITGCFLRLAAPLLCKTGCVPSRLPAELQHGFGAFLGTGSLHIALSRYTSFHLEHRCVFICKWILFILLIVINLLLRGAPLLLFLPTSTENGQNGFHHLLCSPEKSSSEDLSLALWIGRLPWNSCPRHQNTWKWPFCKHQDTTSLHCPLEDSRK